MNCARCHEDSGAAVYHVECGARRDREFSDPDEALMHEAHEAIQAIKAGGDGAVSDACWERYGANIAHWRSKR